MASFSLLQTIRLNYQPKLPSILQHLGSLKLRQIDQPQKEKSASYISLKQYFPQTCEQPFFTFETGEPLSFDPLKVGVVLSGGQAPGGHNVIAGLFDSLKKLNPNSQLIGFCDGPSGIVKNKTIEITEGLLSSYRNQGGFDIIGSGRTKIESPDQFAAALETVKSLELDGLVVIGGDDSNTNAAFLAEYFKKNGLKTRVTGVPKTIDGDLKNECIEVSFGFDTACKIYSEIIGNILKDMLSAKKYYYFIKLMGRSASHITLECALQTHANLSLIGEEIAEKNQTLSEVVREITDLIVQRAEQGKNYGAILIPEGIIEFIPEFKLMIKELNQQLAVDSLHVTHLATLSSQQDRIRYLSNQLSEESRACFLKLPEDIQEQLMLDRDPHGNVQVSKIETERLLIKLVEDELKQQSKKGLYKGKFSSQPLFCGYEGRSGLPSNFDSQYCYALGYVAALLIAHGLTGYIGCVKNLTQPVEQWDIMAAPIFGMLHLEEREGKKKPVIRKALVDLNGVPFSQFKKGQAQWQLADEYCCPGPIQFEGPIELTDSCSLTLLYEQKEG